MTHRGFALLATLWLIVALATVVGLALASGRLGALASRNRVVLTRGRWAAEACLAIVQARWAEHRLTDTATIDLGRTTACSWSVEDPTAKINVNTASRQELVQLLGLPDSLTLREPVTDVDELRRVPGWDSAWMSVLTVDGPGTVNASSATASVLGVLPGMTPEAVEAVVSRREFGRPLTNLDALAGALSAHARATLLASYADLAREITFTAPQLIVTADGWVGSKVEAPHATVQVLVVPLPERLAVIRRRMS